ncbi:MAG: prolipoprotein diacylglyceryl transferase [Rhodospirillaceae bacterium]|mgnify:CR=1 FL=1|nr:prolipoprotein diacylglyceryl transferase [Rhodospirillaceae bacterium]|tara:strand:+ start:27 stop:836 length:810 start_codon:yes stop_codon:yes gene_type:complete
MYYDFSNLNIDPIAIQIGPIAIRWYALAYLAGLLLGWRYCLFLVRRTPFVMAPAKLEDLLVYSTAGIIFGGRLGYVLFYNPVFFLNNPMEIMMIWNGGMSFHGGFLGVVIASLIFSRRNGIETLPLADLLAAAAPLGLFFGRIANFVNGELFGRVTDVPWAIIFPNGGNHPRHPSQLYEAGLEGLLLFAIIGILALLTTARRYPGLLLGVFLSGYGATRAFVEFYREPDAHLGFILSYLTMGQILSLPMILLGIVFFCLSIKRPPITNE